MMVVLDHLTHKNVLIPCTKEAHGTTEPNSHTDMRRIKRASKTLLRIAPESWVGVSNVSTMIDLCHASILGPKRLTRQMVGLSARRHLVPFGFSGPVFDLDLICCFFAGASFDLI
jgi:hypothetical protein